MSTWQGIEELVAIVEHGSMTAAAERLGVSVASISRQLDELEERVGTVLLKRTTRRHSLTAAGEQLFARARDATYDMRALTDELSGRAAELTGPLRITSAGGYVIETVAPLIARFAAQHPGITIHLDVSTRNVDMLAERVDVAFRYGRLPDSSLVARKLFVRRMKMCASPDYLARAGRPRRVSDLKKHACLLGFGDRWPLVVDGRVREVRVQGRWHCNNGPALVAAAEAGLGILYQPETLTHAAVSAGRLVELLPKACLRDIPVSAVTPTRRQLPARVRALLDFVEQHAPRAVAAAM